MDIQEISAHIYVNSEYEMANVACIETGDGLVLVDTPTMPDDIFHWKAFIENMKGAGIEYIVATHHHFDHIMGNNQLGGKVIMQEKAFEAMEQEGRTLIEALAPNLPGITQQKMDFLLNEPILPPKMTFGDRMCLRLGSLNLQLFHIGGHTAGSLCVYVEEHKILLAGDNVNRGQHPFRGQANHLEWIDALKWMKGLEIETIIPGHGELCGKDELDRLIEYLSRLWDIAESLVKKGASLEEVRTETREQLFDFYDIEPERLEEMKLLFDGGAQRLYDEVLTRI